MYAQCLDLVATKKSNILSIFYSTLLSLVRKLYMAETVSFNWHQRPVRKTFKLSTSWSGVDVMITIFCDFCQFSAKKLAFFSKTNVIIKILEIVTVVWAKKRQYFRQIFRRKYFKDHNIGPCSGFCAAPQLYRFKIVLCALHWAELLIKNCIGSSEALSEQPRNLTI
jgi:hypothetical protein